MTAIKQLSGWLLPTVFCGGVALSGVAVGQITEAQKLLPSDGAASDGFGHAAAIDAGVVVIGAPFDVTGGVSSGSVYLFDAATGVELRKITPVDGAAGDEFGYSVAISAGRVVVGARRDGDQGPGSGSAYLFDATTGTLLAKLLASDGAAGDEFGFAVSIDGDTIAVGSKRDDDNGMDSGSLYLFSALSGVQLAKLLPSDGGLNHNFGESVDLDGGVVAVGAHGAGFLAGSAYLFDVSTGAQLHKVLPNDTHANMFFGQSVALDGGVLLVGAWADSIFFDHSGSAYLFDVATGAQLTKLVPSDGHDRDHFGFSVALDAGVAAIGADEDDDSAFDAGSAYLYDVASGTLMTKVLASDGAVGDAFGSAIAIEGGVVVVGAPRDDDLGDSSGSAYLVDALGGVGTVFCPGDGSGGSCPCGNSGAPGHGCANGSHTQGARLITTGSASVAADDLVLSVSGSSSSQPGLLFQGTSRVAGGLGVVFGDGLRCVGGSVVRLQPVAADAQGAAASSLSIVTKGAVVPGQTRRYQWWYRDPLGSPCGGGFNLSNGIEVVWGP